MKNPDISSLEHISWRCQYHVVFAPNEEWKSIEKFERTFPYLYLRLACRSNIIRLLFPFRYPMICDTLYFGGILISIWI